ncbi:MAG: hypothetical protein IJ017_03935 [Oscillospiraceae bacterium]|nr:hypothetical protein [Oscillospiraceae bacterium]
MKVEFRHSFNGFNREEVIDYIRKLTHEKTQAEKAAEDNALAVEDAKEAIRNLKDKLFEEEEKKTAAADEFNAAIAEKDQLIHELREQVRELTEKLDAADGEKSRRLNPIRVKAGGVEAAIRTMGQQLTEFGKRLELAHTEIEEAVVLIDHYTNGADENGNY